MTWTNLLNDDPTEWLLEAEPWTRYQTLTRLLDRPPDDPDVVAARRDLLSHPAVGALIARAAQWFPTPAKRHDDAKLSHYALMVLAEFGLGVSDPGMRRIATTAARHLDGKQFAIRAEVPVIGRSKVADIDPDSDVWSALPCDAPLILYDLLLLGYDTKAVQHAIDDLAARWDNEVGWFCHLFFVESQFKKLGIGCPMAGLMALEVFSQVDDLTESAAARNAFAALREHRNAGRSVYYFGRSDRFWKLKYPFVWYNALYLADVVTRFRFAHGDPLTQELIDWIVESQDAQGRYRPTSMFRAYAEWEFANKKQPSPWITFLCARALRQHQAHAPV